MATKLTKKQKGFVKDYVETGNGRLAAEKNYEVANEHVARSIATENLTKPVIVQAIADRLPDDLLEQVHREGLNAKTFRYSPEGEMIQTDDFATRHKYLDSAYKLKGSYAAEKTHSLNVNLDAKLDNSDAEAIRKRYEAELKAKLLE